MHIPQTQKTLQSSPELAGTTRKFGISANAKAFRVLSANLYSDRIAAVLREYATNAADAHIDNGNGDEPFDLHLPTTLNPHLIIRDYGTGISPDKIENVYMMYFESDKTQSNEFNGMLGLGCKSAFAYTDNFLVTSFQNGKKYVYNAFFDEDDYPNMVPLGVEDTTERNGVEIKIAVRREDFYNFYQKASQVYRRFRIRPKQVGHTVTIRDIKHTEVGNGWKLRSQDYNGSEDGAYAVMANIAYPIKLDDSKLTDKQRAILAADIDISFANGELNIAPSREALTFDSRTVANLQKRLNEIAFELSSRIETEFKNAKNMWEARMTLHSFRRGNLSELKEVLNQLEPMWNGQKITLNNIHFTNPGVTGFRFTKKTMTTCSRVDLPADFAPLPSVMFIENDLKKGAWTRCNIQCLDGAEAVYLLNFADDAAKQEFIKAMGREGMDIPKVSTFPSVSNNNTKYAATAQGKARILRVKNLNSKPTERDHWDVDNVDLDKGGIYFAINRYEITGYDDWNIGWFKDLKTLGFNIDNLKIYGVKNSMLDKISKSPNWITLKEYVKKTIGELLAASDYSKTLGRLQDYENLDNSQVSFFNAYSGCLNDSLQMVCDALVEERKFKATHNSVEQYPAIACRYGVTPLNPGDPDITLNLLMAESLEQYPMLKLLAAGSNSSYIADEYKSVLETYLRDVDEKLKKNSK